MELRCINNTIPNSFVLKIVKVKLGMQLIVIQIVFPYINKFPSTSSIKLDIIKMKAKLGGQLIINKIRCFYVNKFSYQTR